MILVYLKPTNGCNVGCTHCYLPESVRRDRSRMDLPTLRAMAGFLAEMSARTRKQALVLWHGGEPLTLPPDYFLEAGAVLDQFVPGHLEEMQTSLIPFRREFAPLVRDRFGGLLGSSVDFSQRALKGSTDAYQALWMSKVNLARSEGIDVLPGVVPTVRELGREAEVVDWFADREFETFGIDRYNAYGGAPMPDRPTNREHAAILIGLFDALMARMEAFGRAPIERVVSAGIRGVLAGVPGDRWGGSCTSDFVVVEPDGSLGNCPDVSTVGQSFGNVVDGYHAFALNRFRRSSIRRHVLDHKKSYCASCENAHFCGSGCPITPNGPEDDPSEAECAGYKTFLTYVRGKLADGSVRAVAEAYISQAPKWFKRVDPPACAA